MGCSVALSHTDHTDQVRHPFLASPGAPTPLPSRLRSPLSPLSRHPHPSGTGTQPGAVCPPSLGAGPRLACSADPPSSRPGPQGRGGQELSLCPGGRWSQGPSSGHSSGWEQDPTGQAQTAARAGGVGAGAGAQRMTSGDPCLAHGWIMPPSPHPEGALPRGPDDAAQRPMGRHSTDHPSLCRPAAGGGELCGRPGRGAGRALDNYLHLHHALPAQRLLQRHRDPLQGGKPPCWALGPPLCPQGPLRVPQSPSLPLTAPHCPSLFIFPSLSP